MSLATRKYNSKMRRIGWYRRFFWSRHPPGVLKRVILRASAAERRSKREKRADYPFWRALRKRIVAHYARSFGPVPAILQQDRLPTAIFGMSHDAEFTRWIRGG